MRRVKTEYNRNIYLFRIWRDYWRSPYVILTSYFLAFEWCKNAFVAANAVVYWIFGPHYTYSAINTSEADTSEFQENLEEMFLVDSSG